MVVDAMAMAPCVQMVDAAVQCRPHCVDAAWISSPPVPTVFVLNSDAGLPYHLLSDPILLLATDPPMLPPMVTSISSPSHLLTYFLTSFLPTSFLTSILTSFLPSHLTSHATSHFYQCFGVFHPPPCASTLVVLLFVFVCCFVLAVLQFVYRVLLSYAMFMMLV